MNEIEISKRMEQICEQYSLLPEMSKCDLTLEAVDSIGNIRVFISSLIRPNTTAEKVISPTESLDWIQDTFGYPDTLGVLYKDINSNSIDMAYMDDWGYLMLIKEDGSAERFKLKNYSYYDEKTAKVKREQLLNKIKVNLGDKLKIPTKDDKTNN